MQAAIDRTDPPSTNDGLEQLLKVINHNFNFCKKINVNMELLLSNMAWMATYGIIISVPQLVLTLLANTKTATKSEYGYEFCSAMHVIRKKYTYNHVHVATSLQIIFLELAGANRPRVLKIAPAPCAGMVHSVAGLVSFFTSMMDETAPT